MRKCCALQDRNYLCADALLDFIEKSLTGKVCVCRFPECIIVTL